MSIITILYVWVCVVIGLGSYEAMATTYNNNGQRIALACVVTVLLVGVGLVIGE